MIRFSPFLIRQLPFLVDFSFLFSNFICVSVPLDLHVPVEQPSPIVRLASLEAFADPQFQSTPERTHLTHEDSGQVDPDGIGHSFERSTTSFGFPTTSPFGMATFRVRQNTSNVDITGEGDIKDDEGREGVESADIVAEGNDDTGQNRSDTLDPPQLERPNRSSFSAFLACSKSPVPATQAQSTSNAALSTTLFCSTPPTRFVTTSELEALERRFQVLVSSATGSNGAQISNLHPTTGANPIASVSFGTQQPVTPENLASVSTIHPAVRRIATRGKNKRRGRPTPAVRDSNSEEVASRCQPGTSIRPRPRLQLNVQMFKKHPVFKFFVTAQSIQNEILTNGDVGSANRNCLLKPKEPLKSCPIIERKLT